MMKLQVLGMGCPKCNKLYAAVEAAAKELGIAYEMEKIDDIGRIAEMGVLMTPALAIDGKVRFSARIPASEELKKIIAEAK